MTSLKILADSTPVGDVKYIWLENGKEFKCSAFKTLLRNNLIWHETSALYSSGQNWTADRHWRTLFEMGRCLLIQSGLGKELWPYAVMCVIYPEYVFQQAYETNTISCIDWQENKPFKHESVWFRVLLYCLLYTTLMIRKKLNPRSNNDIFVGYNECSPAYLVYYPDTGKEMKCRVVKFQSAARENTV